MQLILNNCIISINLDIGMNSKVNIESNGAKEIYIKSEMNSKFNINGVEE